MFADKLGIVAEWVILIFALTMTLFLLVIGVVVGCSWIFKKEAGYERL